MKKITNGLLQGLNRRLVAAPQRCGGHFVADFINQRLVEISKQILKIVDLHGSFSQASQSLLYGPDVQFATVEVRAFGHVEKDA